MNDSMLGADTQQLRALAKDCATAASEFTQLGTSLSQRINQGERWRGPDADRFRQRWNSHTRLLLSDAARSLDAASATLIRNADEQDKASSAASLGGGGNGFGGGGGFGSGGADHDGSGGSAGGAETADSGFDAFQQGFEVFGDWKTAILDVPGWASTLMKGIDFGRNFDPLFGWKGTGELWGMLPSSGLKNWGEALAGDNWSALSKNAASFLNDKAFFAVLNDSKFAGFLSSAGEGLNGASRALGAAGKALGPLGVGIGVVTTVNDFAQGNTGRGVYDGIMTGLGTAALLTPPPADLILGGGALVMGLGEFAYDKFPGFKSVVDGGISVVEDVAGNVTQGIEDGWDNLTHGKWPWE